MSVRIISATVGIIAAIGLGIIAFVQFAGGPNADAAPWAPQNPVEPSKGTTATPVTKPRIETATVGGGCFWCLEAILERVPGVKNVVSGFAGGGVANPSYEMVCTGLTGHAEVVQIQFDPSVISYEDLLKVFFKSHDPTTLNRQGPDEGTQYRSIILYHSDEQRQTAQALYKKLTAAKAFRDPIVTQLVPFTVFYPADEHHQDYYMNNKYTDYSQIYIAPKVKKVKDWWNKTHKAEK